MESKNPQNPEDLNIEFYKKHLPKHSHKLEILHFNDVYDIEERPVVGQDSIVAGAARFVRAFELYNCKEKLVLFSGDLFFPSNCK